MTKKLIIEYYKGDGGLKQINESVDGLIPVPEGMMRVEGVVGVVDSLNRNKRKYPKQSYKTLIESLQSDIKTGLYGEMEHPTSMNIDNNNISHKIERLWLDESTGEVKATFLLLGEGTKGLIAQNIVRSGGALRASSRGAGDMVGEDVHLDILRTYDLVGTPGFIESKMYSKFGESVITESYIYNEGSCKTTKMKESDNEDNDNKEDIEEIVEKLVNAKLKTNNKQTIDVDAIIKTVTESVLEHVNTKSDLLVTRVEGYLDSYATRNLKIVTESNNGNTISETDFRKSVLNIFKEDIAPVIEKWTINEFMPDMLNGVQNWIVEEYSPSVQNWIVEEYSPSVQNWITNEYSEGLQNWIVEEYSPSVQNWITNEYSEGLQNWIVNEYSEGVQNWVVENVKIKESKNKTKEETDGAEVSDNDIEDKKSDDDNEDDVIEESEIAKSIKMTNDVLSKITEKMTNMGNKRNINEGNNESNLLFEKYFGANAKPYLRLMPESMKLSYISTDDNTKHLIETKANMRVLNTKENIYEFWSNLDVEGLKSQKQFLPSYTRNITESVNKGNEADKKQSNVNSAMSIVNRMFK